MYYAALADEIYLVLYTAWQDPGDANLARLDKVRSIYDPDGRFHSWMSCEGTDPPQGDEYLFTANAAAEPVRYQRKPLARRQSGRPASRCYRRGGAGGGGGAPRVCSGG